MGRCCQLVMGPAGVGKSTYCKTIQVGLFVCLFVCLFEEEEEDRAPRRRAFPPGREVTH
jgi:GTPase SAR1 family protein